MGRRSFSRYQSYRDYQDKRRRLMTVLLVLGALVLVVQALQDSFLRTLRVESQSMEPTLAPGDLVLTVPWPVTRRIPLTDWRWAAGEGLRRGDLIEVSPPGHSPWPWYGRLFSGLVRTVSAGFLDVEAWLREPYDRGTALKRVVGLPGDIVRLEGHTLFIRPAGESFSLSEFELTQSRYRVRVEDLPAGWTAQDPFSGDLGPLTLGPNEVFVLSDTRGGGGDSRLWGPVSLERLESVALFRYWPLDRWAFF